MVSLDRLLKRSVHAVLLELLIASTTGALSNSGAGIWQHFRDIAINNTGGAALYDLQILINLTSVAFPLRANARGAGMRFTDAGGAELAHCFEGWDLANRSWRVWVNLRSVPVGESTVRMWYGNPNATGSSDAARTICHNRR